jgi:transglutaminase-like putative cysteine protease
LLTGRDATPRWQLAAFAIAGAAILALVSGDGYNLLAMRTLVVLAGLKLLESRTPRDLRITAYLGLFLVATLFLLDQTIPMGLFGLAMTWSLVTLLVAVSRSETRPRWRKHGRLGFRLMALAVPFAVFLFLVFPRLSGPLWHLGYDRTSALSGLSDSMAPGAIGELALSTEIAFRAEFAEGVLPPRQAMYWRGPVLWETDGRRWTRRPASREEAVGRIQGGRVVDYQLILEPSGQRWVTALDVPDRAPDGIRITPDLEPVANGVIRERTTYRLGSRLDAGLPVLSPRQKKAGLQLPDDVTARTRKLAEDLAREPGSESGLMSETLRFFREQSFRYTLSPPVLLGNPVDEFLFETRAGFCEHYAAAFVILMRLNGLPARVVTGYLGGELNPHNDQWIVRQSDAHAWAEVWLEGRGWQRVDPTAAVAPERVERGIDLDAALGEGGRSGLAMAGNLWRQLARRAEWIADAVEMAWYRDFVNFTRSRQAGLMERLGLAAMGTTGAALALGAAVVVVIAVTALLTLTARGHRPPPVVAAYEAYCRKLARLGRPRHRGEGPVDYASRVHPQLAPDQAARADLITRSYIDIRYGPSRPGDDRTGHLKRLVARFRPRLLADAER